MRKVVLLLAALLVLTPVAGADIADEIERSTAAATTSRTRLGPGEHAVPAGRPGRTTRTASRSRSPARRPATSATASSTTSTRTCSPRTASPSGASSGASSWTTRSACATRPAARARRSRSTRPTRWRRSATTSARSTSAARRPRPARAPARRRASRSTRSRSYIDGSSVYGGTNARLEWLREGPVDGNLANNGATLLLPDGYLPRARRPRQRGDGAARWR